MLDHAPPWIVGHRGVAAEALENTLESLELAVAQGADMIELDVQLTADGHLAAFHDWDLERLAGAGEVVEESSLELLIERFPRLATLPRILDALPAAMPLNVEIKRRRADARALVRALASALGGRERILLSSFDWPVLEAVRRGLPDRPLAPIGDGSAGELLEAAERLDAWSVHCHHRLAEVELIAAAADRGRPVLAYTVNEAATARELVARGVRGLFTDAPGRLRRELADGPAA